MITIRIDQTNGTDEQKAIIDEMLKALDISKCRENNIFVQIIQDSHVKMDFNFANPHESKMVVLGEGANTHRMTSEPIKAGDTKIIPRPKDGDILFIQPIFADDSPSLYIAATEIKTEGEHL